MPLLLALVVMLAPTVTIQNPDTGFVFGGNRFQLANTDRRYEFTDTLTKILGNHDPETRVLKLRLVASNPGFALLPNMFVDVELPVGGPAGLTVPQDAIIDSGHEQRVFVERSAGVFEPRSVKVGWRSGDRVGIVQGLAEGDRVVVEGTFLVDSESRLKSTAPHLDNNYSQPKNPSKASMLDLSTTAIRQVSE